MSRLDDIIPQHAKDTRSSHTSKGNLLMSMAHVMGAVDHYYAVRTAEAAGEPNPDSQGRESWWVFDADVVYSLIMLAEMYEHILENAPDDLGMEGV